MKHLIFTFVIALAFSFNSSAQAGFTVAPVYCTNQSYSLSANTGTMTNCNYFWTSLPMGVTFAPANGSVTSVTFPQGGQYTIFLMVSNSNTSSVAQQSLTATQPPNLSVSQIGYNNCIKSNDPLVWGNVQALANGASSYSWASPGQVFSTAAFVTVSPTVATCYTLSGSDSLGCVNTRTFCVGIQPQFSIQVSPSNTFICQVPIGGMDVYTTLWMGNPSPLTGPPNSYYYFWSPSWGLMSSPFQQQVNAAPVQTSTFVAEMKDAQGCISLPALVTVSVVNCLDLGMDELKNTSLSLYPNPVQDRLFISGLNEELKGRLELYDAFGRLVLSEAPEAKELTLKDLPPAVYYLHLTTDRHKTVLKVLKQ